MRSSLRSNECDGRALQRAPPATRLDTMIKVCVNPGATADKPVASFSNARVRRSCWIGLTRRSESSLAGRSKRQLEMKALLLLEVLNDFEKITRLRIATWTQ